VRKLLVSVVMAALVLAALGPPAVQAQDPKDVKMVAAVSIGGVDRIMADVKFMGELAGREDVGKMAEGMLKLVTQGKGLEGLDRGRPWGILVGTDGHDFGGCLFVPVSDLAKLMDTAKKMAKDKIEGPDDGVYEVHGRKTVYVQETHKGWAFVVDDPAIFQYVPKDPAKELGGMNKEYDLALRLFPANVPEEHRQKIAAKMRECAKKMAARCKDKDEHRAAIRKIIGKKMFRDWMQFAGDLEEVTIGWNLDEKTPQGVLEVSLVCQKGTPSAKFLAGADKIRTAFGGVELDDALVTARATGKHPPLKRKELDALLEAMQARAYAKVERKAKTDEEEKVGREIVDGFLDVVKKTAATGKIDAAGSLRLHTDSVTYVGARHVADGPQLEATIKKFVAAVREKHAECVDKVLKLDAAKHGGVNMHVVSLPIPEKCPRHDKIVAAVGEKLEIVLGIGPEAVYFAAGRDAMKSLTGAIDASKKAAKKVVPPMEFTLDLEELAELATHCPKEKVSSGGKKALEAFEAAGDGGKVCGALLPIDRGLKFRLVLDEGVLRLMASAHRHRHK